MYVQTTGNSMNAGTTTADSAAYTSTSGNWDGTSIFTPADGSTPSSSVAVNDWLSVYPNGTTSGAVFIAQVTNVAAGVNGAITVSTTAKFGAAPVSGTGTRSCKAGGAWADETALVQLGATTIPQSTKVNWKKGTYTFAAARTIALAGAATTPLWIAGYDTTPGDLDTAVDDTLTPPLLALGANLLTTSGSTQTWSSFDVTSTRSGLAWTTSSTNGHFKRIKISNSSANTAAAAFQINAGSTVVSSCYFNAPSTATANGTVQMSSGATFIECVFEDGGNCCINCGTNTCYFIGCVLNGKAHCAQAILASTGGIIAQRCTILNVTDGIKWTGAPAGGSQVAHCIFYTCTGWGINNASGTNTSAVFIDTNSFYNMTSGQQTGVGDLPIFLAQSESSDPLTSSSDFTPITGSKAKAFVDKFRGQSYSTYHDLGAVQHQDSGSGGGTAALAQIFGG